MATPHVCGLVAALMTKGGKYSDIIKDDASLREVLNEKYVRDIGVTGPDNDSLPILMRRNPTGFRAAIKMTWISSTCVFLYDTSNLKV
jgi:hypothetical protein